MDKKILDFYAAKNLHVAKMIEKRPAGVSRGQVELAAAELYRQIHSEGLQIRDIRIAWTVWGMARGIKADDYEKEMQQLVNADEHAKELSKAHEEELRALIEAHQVRIRKLELMFWSAIAVNNWTWAVWLLFTW